MTCDGRVRSLGVHWVDPGEFGARIIPTLHPRRFAMGSPSDMPPDRHGPLLPRRVPPSDRNRNRRPPRTTTPHSASRIAPPPDHRRSPPANHRHSATSPALPTFFLPPAHLEREWVSTIFVRPDGNWGRERERCCLVCCCGAFKSQLDQLSLPLVGRRAFCNSPSTDCAQPCDAAVCDGPSHATD